MKSADTRSRDDANPPPSRIVSINHRLTGCVIGPAPMLTSAIDAPAQRAVTAHLKRTSGICSGLTPKSSRSPVPGTTKRSTWRVRLHEPIQRHRSRAMERTRSAARENGSNASTRPGLRSDSVWMPCCDLTSWFRSRRMRDPHRDSDDEASRPRIERCLVAVVGDAEQPDQGHADRLRCPFPETGARRADVRHPPPSCVHWSGVLLSSASSASSRQDHAPVAIPVDREIHRDRSHVDRGAGRGGRAYPARSSGGSQRGPEGDGAIVISSRQGDRKGMCDTRPQSHTVGDGDQFQLRAVPARELRLDPGADVRGLRSRRRRQRGRPTTPWTCSRSTPRLRQQDRAAPARHDANSDRELSAVVRTEQRNLQGPCRRR